MNSELNRMEIGGAAKAYVGRIRLLLGCLLVAGVALGARSALGQMVVSDSAASKLPEKQFWTKNGLSFPVRVEERDRMNIREIHLYVKEFPNGPWQLAQKAPSTQSGFEFRFARDGEYWFNVVTIDQFGRQDPPDLSKEPPAQIIVLDTTPPTMDVKALGQSPDGLCLRCDVRDANPNPYQTKFEFQTGDRVWRLLDPMPSQPESFCIPKQAVLTGMIKITAVDRAMNATVREFSLSALGSAGSQTNVAGLQNNGFTPASFEPPSKNAVTQPAQHISPVTGGAMDPSKAPTMAATRQKEPNELPFKNGELPSVQQDLPSQASQLGGESTTSAKAAVGKWQIVNQPRVSLDYRIDDEGKSGVGKVEVWITKDGGRTWDVLCDDADKKSPVVFDLPGEGVFGFHLSVTNGRGFGATPPKAGDVADCIVELDTTKPQAELRSAKLGPAEEGCMDIAWQASDKNLGSTPIDLFYGASQQGPWTPIAKGVANTGKYRWYLPREVGSQAFVRMVVADAAGNITRCETTQAVALDDGTRPRAVIGTIMPVSMVVPPGGGNN